MRARMAAGAAAPRSWRPSAFSAYSPCHRRWCSQARPAERGPGPGRPGHRHELRGAGRLHGHQHRPQHHRRRPRGQSGQRGHRVPPGTVTGGVIHANDAVAAQAQSDLTTAYNDAAGRTPSTSESGDLTGQTLTAGVYKSTSSLGLTGTVTLDAQGDPDAVFIFQVNSTLITGSGSDVAPRREPRQDRRRPAPARRRRWEPAQPRCHRAGGHQTRSAALTRVNHRSGAAKPLLRTECMPARDSLPGNGRSPTSVAAPARGGRPWNTSGLPGGELQSAVSVAAGCRAHHPG
jgi:hypothetical protein